MSGGPGEAHGHDEVGGVAEEAAKLFSALQDWAKDSAGETAGSATSAASGLAEGIRHVNEHIANGGADCAYCPVCQVIHRVRQTSPEVRGHLAVAASSLLQAAAGLLTTQVPEPRTTRVQKIDLDAGEEGWDEPEGDR